MAEVKRNRARINLAALEKKAEGLLHDYRGYKPAWLGLSLEDSKELP